MKLSIMFEGQLGVTWPRWQRLASEVEQLGFAGLFRSDHFTMPEPPDLDSLEAMVSLTYLASHTRRIHFGPLVAPFSFRDPVMLARQAMALDDLSGGRMILGVGAGWQEREHAMFGYDLGDVPTRLARLEEGLEVVMRLIRSDEPVSFTGRFYQLREARLLPRPQRRPPILLGGNGPKRTLPLVARYADIWNGVMISAELYAERSALLDELLRAEGRQPQDIQRTLMTPVLCWRNAQELEDRVQHLRREFARFAELPTATVLDRLRGDNAGILGTPEQVVERLQQYASAGVEEVMMQWLSLDDIEGMAILAESVLPNLQD